MTRMECMFSSLIILWQKFGKKIVEKKNSTNTHKSRLSISYAHSMSTCELFYLESFSYREYSVGYLCLCFVHTHVQVSRCSTHLPHNKHFRSPVCILVCFLCVLHGSWNEIISIFWIKNSTITESNKFD